MMRQDRLNNKLRFALHVVAALTAMASTIPAAHAEDLLAAYRLAQASDPTFASAQYTLEGVREKIPQARANLLPVAAITGNDGNTRADTEFTDVPPVDRNMKAWGWNLQLTQPIVRVGTVYAYRESGYVVQQAEAQYAQARQDLLLRVAQALRPGNVSIKARYNLCRIVISNESKQWRHWMNCLNLPLPVTRAVNMQLRNTPTAKFCY